MNKDRIEKLNSFLKEIRNVDLQGKKIKSFTIEQFEKDQQKIRNKRKSLLKCIVILQRKDKMIPKKSFRKRE